MTQKRCSRTSPNFSGMLPVAMARCFCHGAAICYVLLVLWMTSCFHTMGPTGGQTGTVLCTRLPVAAGECRLLWVGHPASLQAVLQPRWPRTRDIAFARHFSLLVGHLSLCTRKQSAVITVEAATRLWPCGSLCLEEVCHTDIKIV